MADEHARLLERGALGGDLQAEAAVLVGRVRAGTLSSDELKLLSFLRHPAAVEVTGGWMPSEIPKVKPCWIKQMGVELATRYDPNNCLTEVTLVWINKDTLDPVARYFAAELKIPDSVARAMVDAQSALQRAKRMVYEDLVPDFRRRLFDLGHMTDADACYCLSQWGFRVVREVAVYAVLWSFPSCEDSAPSTVRQAIDQVLAALQRDMTQSALTLVLGSGLNLEGQHPNPPPASREAMENKALSCVRSIFSIYDRPTGRTLASRLRDILRRCGLKKHELLPKILLPAFTKRILDNSPPTAL